MEPTRRPATTLLSQGTVLENRYEILRIAGRGGMSTVYAARDLRFHHVERLCAIKEMHVAAPDDKTRVLRIANFEQEAAMLATLSHQAIPKIFDFFANGGLVYLVLEFIEGQNLESIIDNSSGPIAEETLIDWALQVLDVLDYLHSQEPEPIVFRDMKPSNVMLRPDGRVALIDFGIARTFQPLQKGTMIGTEGYAPPEQYRGIAEPRGDLYALGATLHHLATKADPRSETPFTFDQRPARKLNPELSREFEDILKRAIAYSAADRFPSAKSMVEALKGIRKAVGPQAEVPAHLNSPRQATELNINSAPGSTLIDHVDDRQPYAEEMPAPDGTLPVRERVLWTVATGDEVRGSPYMNQRRTYIGSYDAYVYSLDHSQGSVSWRFRCQKGVVARPVTYEDLVIVGSEDQNLYAIRSATGRMEWSFRTAMAVRSSAAVVDDFVVFGADDGYCYAVDAGSGQLRWRHRTWGPVRSSPAVYQDSLVVGSDDGALYRIMTRDGRVVWRSHLGERVLSSPVIDAGVVIVGNAQGTIFGLSFQTGDIIWRASTQRPVLASPKVLGNVAYIGSTDGAIYALSAEDGTEIWKSQIANQITSTVSIYSGYGYVGTIDGFVHCLNLRDGSTVWSHRLGGPVTSTPAIGDGVVVVGCFDSKIYGLRL
jgi:eukaryotic-like serine/threonine-protein kinase